MKRAVFVLFACACSHSRDVSAVEIAAPLASAQVAPVHDEAALPRGARQVSFGAGADWAASFPAAKTFATFDLPEAHRVLLTWRVGKGRAVQALPESEDYPGNHVAPVALAIEARGATRIAPFGELSGSIPPPENSWCAGTSYKPTIPAFGAVFSIGTMQGGDEIVVVRDGGTLHVLHRETSDGSCEDAKQGPLDVCEGFQWERAADIHVPAAATIWEMIEDEGKPLDCGTE